MLMTLRGMAAAMTVLPCLCLLAVGQTKGAASAALPGSNKFDAMRHLADAHAKAIAAAAQAHAIKWGKFDNVMSDYAQDFGGKLPLNPCTGTRTGYTMIVFNNGKATKIAATAGINCGKWTPKVFERSLKR